MAREIRTLKALLLKCPDKDRCSVEGISKFRAATVRRTILCIVASGSGLEAGRSIMTENDLNGLPMVEHVGGHSSTQDVREFPVSFHALDQ
jgi:hypothetical protein